MILFPAVDIKGGRCVRLKRGRADEETVFETDPVQAALRWQTLGAEWLHLVDMDGAFAGKPVNLALITRLCAALSIPVQMGGGIRNLDTAMAYADAGVSRLIIGTLAVEDPHAYEDMCTRLPGRIGVSLDTDGGRIKTRGWIDDSGLTIEQIMPRLYAQGTAFVIHTDIGRDGMQSGVNLTLLEELAEASPMPVIAAGGVATLDDIKALYPISLRASLEGVISGRAIYTGSLDFKEAVDWLKVRSSGLRAN
ncbi:MAG: 1-(5-phosphoribosyl)-5-[(5-phosphoribosylamino)methylideneamino]imidazole-4-carboxamide isomerase [Desulfovibrio sp.]|jgi:phosphoribosylformimino-5-aminoimidazole carboxamide ribotide isomerase|nr:1-(5-phosphoribosyl)-5-[(5-phosphoribosylamino)methylideneamino]imidazole-4-carboxamide isomerase [Desulfovibrio sp.]